MSMPNGWNPVINRVNAVLSGDTEPWYTAGGTSLKLADRGGRGCWAGLAPVWNRNDNHTVFNLGKVLPKAYNDYRGRDDGYWAGATDTGSGLVDLYENDRLVAPVITATKPRLGGGRFVFISPFQGGSNRQLFVDFKARQTGSITDAAISPDGAVLLYQTDYANIWAEDQAPTGTPRNAVPQEKPIGVCIGPDGLPWVASETPRAGGEIVVHPVIGEQLYMGYRFTGEFYNSNWRMQGALWRGVGSSSHGELRDVYVNFSEPRQDLRQH